MPDSNAVQIVYKTPEIIQVKFGMEQSNTYLIIDSGHAIVVDVCSVMAVDELFKREIEPDYVILTHEHVDHLWGLNDLRERFPEAKVIAQESCSKNIVNPKTNKAAQYRIYATLRFGESYHNKEAMNRKYCCLPAEITFSDIFEFKWHSHNFKIVHTPGHSSGSSIIFMDDVIVFTGDTVLNEDSFLKFDDGDEELFSLVTSPIINRIKPDTIILPGHGNSFIKKIG